MKKEQEIIDKNQAIETIKPIFEKYNSFSKDHGILKSGLSEEINEEKQHYDINGEPIVDYKLTTDGDEIVEGILDILPDGYGFLRGENYLSSDKDVYVSMVQVRRFRLDTGDVIKGISRYREGEKFPSLIFVGEVNGEHPEKAMKRKRFDELTPIYPNERLIKQLILLLDCLLLYCLLPFLIK